LLGLASFTFLLHVFVSIFTEYGYFIDEFYYIACTKRLAFGYVDQPPLSIFLLAVNRWILGDSLPALHFLPSLASAFIVFFTGLIARRFGGGIAAQGLAALGAVIAPAYLVFGGFYSMNPFEFLVWTMIMYLVIRIIQEENPKLWTLVGLLLGLGLEMKHTMILYAFGLAVGILLTSARKHLWNRWFIYGGLIAFLLLLPNIIWQIANGFSSLEFYRNATAHKNVPTGPVEALVGQIFIVNPANLPFVFLGMLYLFARVDGKAFRAFGWGYVVILLAMIAGQSSRPDRIAAAYTLIFAAGAVVTEQYAVAIKRRWPVFAMTILLVIGGCFVGPVSVPLLPPATLVRYLTAIGFSLKIEQGKSAKLPQWLADRFGWKELAAAVGTVYHNLPPDEQRNCVIIAGSYGQAGACELYGDQYGLPSVYSTHNSYFLWGPPPDSVRTYIGVLVRRTDLEGLFQTVDIAGQFTCEYCMNYESNIPIYVARGPRQAVSEVWPKVKHFE
jgi:4-amino-4-deoxy-L-arabinose transferase-like glycosyltransferase